MRMKKTLTKILPTRSMLMMILTKTTVNAGATSNNKNECTSASVTASSGSLRISRVVDNTIRYNNGQLAAVKLSGGEAWITLDLGATK